MFKILIAVGGYILSKFVLKLLAALGLAWITYKGLVVLTERLIDGIQPSLSGLPSRVLDLMALSGAPEALSIICSALLTSAAIAAGRAWLVAAK